MEQTPLINDNILLEKFKGKGGWTYVAVPGIPPEQRRYLLTHRVKGFIDDYEIRQGSLMPMGKDKPMFLPVNATIRKQIGKQEGDYVKVILYAEEEQLQVIPEDFMECLQDEPSALKAYQQLPEKDQQACLHWLMEVSVADVKIQRMADAIDNLADGRAFNAPRRSTS